MDSWYLHHPLVNLARMVKQGVEEVKEMLMHSVEYAIKVAHHFNYEWPVFYHLDTLEVLKAETEPGKGGEHDVAGIYTLSAQPKPAKSAFSKKPPPQAAPLRRRASTCSTRQT